MYVFKYTAGAFLAVLALPQSFAQVSTSCQPLNSTCPNDLGLTASSYFIDFTAVDSLPSDWQVANYETVGFGPNGAQLAFTKRFDAPLIRSDFNFFFGSVEYVVQGALGKGIVSSMVLLSDDLDEIDWEMTGTGGSQIETNYYGKGVPNYNNYQYINVTTPQRVFHTYGLQWSSESLIWSIDNVVVRTLTPTEAGNSYPQTPMHVSLSLWDGGDPSEAPGTMNWAGGETPLPPPENYTMYIKSVRINNAMPGAQYQYTDKSGSWQSIKVLSNATNPILNSSSTIDAATMEPSNIPLTANKPAPFRLANTTPYLSSTSSMSSIATSASLVNTKATAPITFLPILNSTNTNISTSAAMLPSFSVPSASAPSAPSAPTQAKKVLGPIITPASMSPSASTFLPLLTQKIVTTEIIYTSLTSCPVTNTITSNGTHTQQVTTQVSTIILTSTSTICTRCVAPVMSTTPTTSVALVSPGPAVSSPPPARVETPTASHSPVTPTLSTSSNRPSVTTAATSALSITPSSSASSPPPSQSPLTTSSSTAISSPLPTTSSLSASSPTPSQSPFTTSSPTTISSPSPVPTTAQELVTSEIVYSTMTTCPVTNTITPLSGTPTLRVTTSISTILSTSTSTVCTKCIAPIASTQPTTIASSPSLISSLSSTISASNASSMSPQVTSSVWLSGAPKHRLMTSNLSSTTSPLAVGVSSSATSSSAASTPSGTGPSITQDSTTITPSATGAPSAMPAGIFTPISQSALSASGSGIATVTSSVTMGETLTMTSYGVSPTASSPGVGNLTGNGTTTGTPAQFKGVASNISAPAAFLTFLTVAITAFYIL